MLVVGLNQTIDRTIRLPALAPGQVLRALDARVTPGGKAVNVCRAARTMVHPARLVGPFPGRLGAVARELLLAEGLDVDAVAVDGEIRGTTVVLEDGGRTTVINEPGPALDGGAWRRVLAAVEQSIVGGAWMAVCGSVPPGVDPGAHATLIALAHDRGAPVAVDVTGGRLVEAAAAGADLVSPNLAEAEDAVRIAGGSPVTVRRGGRRRRPRPQRRRGPLPGGGRRARRARRRCGHGVGRSSRRGLRDGRSATSSCRRRRSTWSTRSVPATRCSAPRSWPSSAVDPSRWPCAKASPTPQPRSPTPSPATPIRRWWRPSGGSSCDDPVAAAPGADGHRRRRPRRGLPQDGVARPQQRGQRATRQGRQGPPRRRGARLPPEPLRPPAAHPRHGVDDRRGHGERRRPVLDRRAAGRRGRHRRRRLLHPLGVDPRPLRARGGDRDRDGRAAGDGVARGAHRGRPVVPGAASWPAARRWCASTGPPSAPRSTPSSPTTSAVYGGACSC